MITKFKINSYVLPDGLKVNDLLLIDDTVLLKELYHSYIKKENKAYFKLNSPARYDQENISGFSYDNQENNQERLDALKVLIQNKESQFAVDLKYRKDIKSTATLLSGDVQKTKCNLIIVDNDDFNRPHRKRSRYYYQATERFHYLKNDNEIIVKTTDFIAYFNSINNNTNIDLNKSHNFSIKNCDNYFMETKSINANLYDVWMEGNKSNNIHKFMFCLHAAHGIYKNICNEFIENTINKIENNTYVAINCELLKTLDEIKTDITYKNVIDDVDLEEDVEGILTQEENEIFHLKEFMVHSDNMELDEEKSQNIIKLLSTGDSNNLRLATLMLNKVNPAKSLIRLLAIAGYFWRDINKTTNGLKFMPILQEGYAINVGYKMTLDRRVETVKDCYGIVRTDDLKLIASTYHNSNAEHSNNFNFNITVK